MAARKTRESAAEPAKPSSGESLRAIFWAVLLALAIRSFLVEPFKIPSGSMIPTLLVGDYVLVNKFAYGVRMPYTGKLLVPVGKPARGDIMVFRFPDDTSQDFIKRVIGLPGDRIEVRADRLWVNDQIVDRVPDGMLMDPAASPRGPTNRYIERNPEGREYSVLYVQRPTRMPLLAPRGPWVVPEGHYFMMGDNRDNSQDSRMWKNPFVRADQIKGRAFRIHWSWDVEQGPADRGFVLDLLHTVWQVVTLQVKEIRWNRIGRSLDGIADGAGGEAAAPSD